MSRVFRKLVPCLVLWSIAALSPVVGCGSAWAEDAGLEQAPADPVAAARAAWEAEPLDIRRGLHFEALMTAAGRARAVGPLFRASLRAHAKHPAAAFLYGHSKGGEAGLAAMRAALDKRLGLPEGRDADLLAAWVALVVMEVASGNADEAARAASEITALRGGAADWTYLGWIQERMQNRPAEAMRAYRLAMRTDPDYLPARNALAVLEAHAGRKKEALALARESAQKHPHDAGTLLHLGLVQALAGDARGASASYVQALADAGDDPTTLASIAGAFMDIEEHNLASAALQRALAIDPNHVQVLTNAALLELAKGNAKEARRHLKRAAKQRPRDGRIAYLQAVSEERLGLPSKAVTSYRRAVTLDAGNVDYVLSLGLALRNAGSFSPAIAKFKQAIAMAPKRADLHLQLGITYMKRKKYRPARDAFLDAAERDRKSPRPHYYLAIIYGDRLSKPKEALAALETYVKLGGNEPSALSWLEELKAVHGGD